MPSDVLTAGKPAPWAPWAASRRARRQPTHRGRGSHEDAVSADHAHRHFPAPLGSARSSGRSVGHSGWSWGNPLPQGNDIQSLEFIGSRGYAAGKFGTLLRTDDAGAGWGGVVTGITGDLARVRIIDADSLVIAGGCALRRSDDAGQTFTRLPWTASDLNCPQQIVTLAFPSEQVGYVVISNGGVFRTADGGRTWTRKTTVPGTPPAGPPFPPPPLSSDVHFTGPDTGVALSGGQIYRTADGAGSWTLVTTHSQRLNGLFFVDATTGYAIGNASSVLKTTDGGATWTVKASGGSLNLTSIRCANASICLATVEDGSQLLRTTNGGDAFSSVTPSTSKIFAAAFTSAARAVAAGIGGTTVASNDSGVTWSSVGAGFSGTYSRLRATSPSLAFAVGADGALARTTDGGNTWSTFGVSTSGSVVDASFLSPTLGYVVDSEGAVLKTDNGAASWQILNTGTTADPGAVLALDANRVLLFGPRGVRISTNGGGEFGAVRGRVLRRADVYDYDRAGSSIFAFGEKDVIVSTNAGKRWKKVKAPTSRRTDLVAVDFVSGRRGYALTDDDRVWQTRNRGRSWRQVWGVGTGLGIDPPLDSKTDLSFFGTRTGWIVQDGFGDREEGGYVLRTSDGGKTWRPQLVYPTAAESHGGLLATGENTGLLLFGPAGFFATASGGDAGTPTTLTLKASKRQLRKRTTIKVSGKLTPAEGGERVAVSARSASGPPTQEVATVASNGTFTTSWKVRRTTYFVAQWAGDDDRAGDGSKALVVKLGRRRR